MSDCQGHGQYYQCKGLLLTITGWKHLTNMCGETLSMNLHKHQLYLLEQHSKSLKKWSAIIWINTEGKSSIMKLGPDNLTCTCTITIYRV